jgi:uncharacterized protein
MSERMIGLDELELLAVGGAVLGSGGGGDPYIGKLMAASALRRHGKVRLLDIADLADDALVVASCMMGAPTVMVEKLPRGDEAALAFRRIGQHLGRPVDAVLCIEAGGINSTIPFVVAAPARLPLLDGDGMGRAFPELQMVTFTLHNIAATPMALTDDKGNTVFFETISNRWTERLARSATVDMGGAALVAFYPMTGAQAKQAAIRGTVSLAIGIGACIAKARAARADPVAAVARKLSGAILLEGRVVDAQRRTVGGFVRGEASIAGTGAWDGRILRLAFQNEFLLAERDATPVAMTPDLIILLDSETGAPVTTEAMRYGLRVTALGAPCDVRWRTPAGLAIVGPGYFGYDIDYVPVEILAAGPQPEGEKQ